MIYITWRGHSPMGDLSQNARMIFITPSLWAVKLFCTVVYLTKMHLQITIAATPVAPEKAAATKQVCFHCGEDCQDEQTYLAEKPFCCIGCKTVYEILHNNDLCQYYDLEKTPGISLRGRKDEQYAWLDDPEVVEKLLDFTDGHTSKATLYLPQIHCASCIWLVENLYKITPGILSSKVNFLKKEVYLTFSEEQSSLRKIVELLASIGYAPALNLGTLEDSSKKPVSKRLIYQLGVAGFAFGNIMLLSFPEYFGLSATEDWFKQAFGVLNIGLATPVLLFSGRDYLASAWHSLRTRQLGIDVPLALGIVVLYFRSAFEILTDTGPGYMDSLAGLVFFLLIGKWFQQMTYHRISFERDYKSYFPIAASRLAAGNIEQVKVNKLEPGDLILVRHAELVPADGILKKGSALIDYSFVSGEAEPVRKGPGEKIYAGGRQVGGAIELLLTKKVSQSYLTQLWNEDAFQQEKSGGQSRLANKISRYFTAIILTISLVTLFYWLPIDDRTAFNAFTAVLIIACPCAAALNIPFTLGNAIRILSRKGFFLKNTNVIEALHRISAVVFDKTGTLTLATGHEMQYNGGPLSKEEALLVRSLAHLSNHPISRQLAAQLEPGARPLDVGGFEEVAGQGISGKVAGRAVRIGSLQYLGHSPVDGNAAPGNVWVEIDGSVKGSFSFHNHYRESAEQLIDWFRQRKKIYLLSGDNEKEREYLLPKFGKTDDGSLLHFNQSPKSKLHFVKKLQEAGEKVLMLGDGLNDAGALKQSDVGIVVAENANNFTPACDAILDARQFAQLPRFIEFAKGSIHVVYAAWAIAVLYNFVGLYFAVQGLLSPVIAAILMPISSLTIVTFGVGASTLLAKRKL